MATLGKWTPYENNGTIFHPVATETGHHKFPPGAIVGIFAGVAIILFLVAHYCLNSIMRLFGIKKVASRRDEPAAPAEIPAYRRPRNAHLPPHLRKTESELELEAKAQAATVAANNDGRQRSLFTKAVMGVGKLIPSKQKKQETGDRLDNEKIEEV
jgi:hypothetical protein